MHDAPSSCSDSPIKRRRRHCSLCLQIFLQNGQRLPPPAARTLIRAVYFVLRRLHCQAGASGRLSRCFPLSQVGQSLCVSRCRLSGWQRPPRLCSSAAVCRASTARPDRLLRVESARPDSGCTVSNATSCSHSLSLPSPRQGHAQPLCSLPAVHLAAVVNDAHRGCRRNRRDLRR